MPRENCQQPIPGVCILVWKGKDNVLSGNFLQSVVRFFCSIQFGI